jgi:hypothetical protein
MATATGNGSIANPAIHGPAGPARNDSTSNAAVTSAPTNTHPSGARSTRAARR